MRALLALSLAVFACTDSSVPVEQDEDLGDGKEDSAGATLCDGLPAASKALCTEIPNNGWRTALKAELTKPYFESLAQAVAEARAIDARSTDVADNVYPAESDTFAAFRRVSPGRVKVVIVGQDPYFREDQAMGLSFSVTPGLPVPPSLENIYAELVREAADATASAALPSGFECPEDGDLTPWATRGVFMLNAILTVRDGLPGSHEKFGWQSLTDAVLRVIRERNARQGTVYMLWGAFARSTKPLILGQENGATPAANPNVLVLESNHPSPLATGFVGKGHFSSANEFLVAKGRTAVDWSLPTPAEGVRPAHDCTER